MQRIGQENLTVETLLTEVMYSEPTLNDHTIFTTIMSPLLEHFEAHPVDSEYPDVAAESPI